MEGDMNEQPEIVAERRLIKGKKVRILRQRGLIPATMYGHHLAPLSLQLERKPLEELLRRGQASALLRLKVGRERPVSVLIKQYQRHPTRDELLHVDFYGVSGREKIKAVVPLRFVGEPPAAEAHDVVIVKALDQVEVECYPADLPRAVEVDLTRLGDVHATVRVKDLDPGPKVTISDPPEEVVVSVAPTAREVIETLEEQAEEAEAAEAREEAGEETERAA